MSQRFPKSGKLCGQLRIQALYRQGKRFTQWPLRISYLPVAEEDTRVLIWAPKSLFKHAVDRNRLRRLMREAYRLEQAPLQESPLRYQIAFNYMDKQEQSQALIRKSMRKAIAKIVSSESTDANPTA